MNVSTQIQVQRGDDMIEVTVDGVFENYGSANPHERGWSLSCWDVSDPPHFELTKEEIERAQQKLYDAMWG